MIEVLLNLNDLDVEVFFEGSYEDRLELVRRVVDHNRDKVANLFPAFSLEERATYNDDPHVRFFDYDESEDGAILNGTFTLECTYSAYLGCKDADNEYDHEEDGEFHVNRSARILRLSTSAANPTDETSHTTFEEF